MRALAGRRSPQVLYGTFKTFQSNFVSNSEGGFLFLHFPFKDLTQNQQCYWPNGDPKSQPLCMRARSYLRNFSTNLRGWFGTNPANDFWRPALISLRGCGHVSDVVHSGASAVPSRMPPSVNTNIKHDNAKLLIGLPEVNRTGRELKRFDLSQGSRSYCSL